MSRIRRQGLRREKERPESATFFYVGENFVPNLFTSGQINYSTLHYSTGGRDCEGRLCWGFEAATTTSAVAQELVLGSNGAERFYCALFVLF